MKVAPRNEAVLVKALSKTAPAAALYDRVQASVIEGLQQTSRLELELLSLRTPGRRLEVTDDSGVV